MDAEPFTSRLSKDDPPIVAWTTFGRDAGAFVNGLATFSGPGGFAQQRMLGREAAAIAQALGVEFKDES